MNLGNEIYDELLRRGYPPHIAAAFMDNFVAESGLDPTINERAPLVPGSRGGRGLYQLTGPRRNDFEERYGTDYDWRDQLDWLDYELANTERAARDAIWKAKTREEAADIIQRRFLRPAKIKNRANMWEPTMNYGLSYGLSRPQAGIGASANLGFGPGVGSMQAGIGQGTFPVAPTRPRARPGQPPIRPPTRPAGLNDPDWYENPPIPEPEEPEDQPFYMRLEEGQETPEGYMNLFGTGHAFERERLGKAATALAPLFNTRSRRLI